MTVSEVPAASPRTPKPTIIVPEKEEEGESTIAQPQQPLGGLP